MLPFSFTPFSIFFQFSVLVLYIDYGQSTVLLRSRCLSMPSGYLRFSCLVRRLGIVLSWIYHLPPHSDGPGQTSFSKHPSQFLSPPLRNLMALFMVPMTSQAFPSVISQLVVILMVLQKAVPHRSAVITVFEFFRYHFR